MLAVYDYNGYKLVIRSTNPPKVQVYKVEKDLPLFEATSLDQAMKWVDENKE